ncbi:MAG: type III pantothenate kinase [Planctomycetes bacterium]|nr:type III pantothenate kinase [Planctomycetota bacterium]
MNCLLAVDIGNSALKIGRFPSVGGSELDVPQRVWEFHYEGFWPKRAVEGTAGTEEAPALNVGQELWNAFEHTLPDSPVQWVVASVQRERERALSNWIRRHRPADSYRLLTYRDVPLRIEVRVPERVGLDRLATSVAANWLRPARRPAIVVDAGTALKVHAVSSEGAFLGGSIFPGYRLAGKALAVQADLLPEVGVSSRDLPPSPIGRDTESAIRSGLFWGFSGAARELVTRIAAELAETPMVFVSGGDAQGLVPVLGPQAEFVPEMCLRGIARIAASLQDGATGMGNEALP